MRSLNDILSGDGICNESRFINPNELYVQRSGDSIGSGGYVTFFYLDNEIKKYDGGETHFQVLDRDWGLRKRIEELIGLSGLFLRVKMEEGADVLLGRYGVFRDRELGNIFLISLWNKGLVRDKIVDFLKKMVSGGVLKKVGDDYVDMSGNVGYVSSREMSGYVSDFLKGVVKSSEMSDEDRERLEMHRRLHLMKPDEKKAAMGELGLGGMRDSRRGDWESGLRKAGYSGYMTQSEGIDISETPPKGDFITPDNIWEDGSESIIYADGKLYGSGHYRGLKNKSTHIEMLRYIPKLKRKVEAKCHSAWDYRVWHGLNEVLFGRLIKGDLSEFRDSIPDFGNPRGKLQLVSFWNDLSNPLLKKMAEDCIKRLYSDGYLLHDDPAFISSMSTGTIPIADFMGGGVSGISDEDKRRLDMMQKLHLMKPDEKKAAMGELGLGGMRVGKRGDWQSAMRKAGYSGYMTQSEGVFIGRDLNSIKYGLSESGDSGSGSGEFITPDDIWQTEGDSTFIYMDGVLYLPMNYGMGGRDTHIDMLLRIPELRVKVDPSWKDKTTKDMSFDVNNLKGVWKTEYFNKAREYAVSGSGMRDGLFGRYAKGNFKYLDHLWKGNISSLTRGLVVNDNYLPDDADETSLQIISFWNTDRGILNRLMKPCIEKLFEYRGHNDLDRNMQTVVSTSVFGTVKLEDFMAGRFKSKEMSDEDRERLDMWRKLHLAHPDEKKELMSKLGLGGTRVSRRGDWQSAMRKAGYSGYMTQSEGVVADISEIKGDFINPDVVWYSDYSKTFIYSDKLYMASDLGFGHSVTHFEMLTNDVFQKDINGFGDVKSFRWKMAEKVYLLGRIGNYGGRDFSYLLGDKYDLPDDMRFSLITFWNSDSALLDAKLGKCIDKLKEKGVIPSGYSVFVSLPKVGTIHESKLGSFKIKMSDEERNKLDMWRKLHLAHPDEKKELMSKLGLGGGRDSRRGEWESGLRKAGYSGYMTQSEGFR